MTSIWLLAIFALAGFLIGAILFPRRLTVEVPRTVYRDTPAKKSDRPVSEGAMARRIDDLDLSSVKERLSEEGWDGERIRRAVLAYRQFLYLYGIGTHPIVPWSDDLDQVWHAHILQMRKYEEDCRQLFGETLYHDTAMKRGTKMHAAGVQATRAAYQRTFEPPRNVSSDQAASYRSDSEDSFMPFYMWAAMQPSPAAASYGISAALESPHGANDSWGAHPSGGDSGSTSSPSCGSSCGSSCGGGGGGGCGSS